MTLGGKLIGQSCNSLRKSLFIKGGCFMKIKNYSAWMAVALAALMPLAAQNENTPAEDLFISVRAEDVKSEESGAPVKAEAKQEKTVIPAVPVEEEKAPAAKEEPPAAEEDSKADSMSPSKDVTVSEEAAVSSALFSAEAKQEKTVIPAVPVEEEKAPAAKEEPPAAAPKPTKQDKVLSELARETDKRVQEILSRTNISEPASTSIQTIESLKQRLAALEMQSKPSPELMQKLRDEMEAEIQARRNEDARLAELQGDGVTMNERGRQRLENDVKEIQRQYEIRIKELESGTSSGNAEEKAALKMQIQKEIASLESRTFTATSLVDSQLSMRAGHFDGSSGKDWWTYTLELPVGEGTAVKCGGTLTYTQISGKTIPAVPVSGSSNYEEAQKNYNSYLDAVDIFDKAFSSGVKFVYATVTYRVKTAVEPSGYIFEVSDITFTNAVTGKTVAKDSTAKRADYQFTPVTDVDFRTPASVPSTGAQQTIPLTPASGSQQTIPLTPVQPRNPIMESQPLSPAPKFTDSPETKAPATAKNQEQKTEQSESRIGKINSRQKDQSTTKPEEQNREKKYSDGTITTNKNSDNLVFTSQRKTTIGSLFYALPGKFSYYVNKDTSFLTIGYGFSLGILPHLYIGANTELNMLTLRSKNSSASKSKYKFSGVVTGVIGANFNLGDSVRVSAFGEAGMVLDKFAYGGGTEFEFFFPESHTGVTLGYTFLTNQDMQTFHKISAGIEMKF